MKTFPTLLVGLGPVAIAAVVFPGPPDAGLPPALAGALPLAWAVLVSALTRADAPTVRALLLGSLPASAWAIAAWGASVSGFGPALLHAAASAASFGIWAVYGQTGVIRGTSALARTAVSGACVAAHALAGPWAAVALGLSSSLAAAYAHARKERSS